VAAPLGAPPAAELQNIEAVRAQAATFRAQVTSCDADAASTTRVRSRNAAAPTL
jgi:hypothetical protein